MAESVVGNLGVRALVVVAVGFAVVAVVIVEVLAAAVVQVECSCSIWQSVPLGCIVYKRDMHRDDDKNIGCTWEHCLHTFSLRLV